VMYKALLFISFIILSNLASFCTKIQIDSHSYIDLSSLSGKTLKVNDVTEASSGDEYNIEFSICESLSLPCNFKESSFCLEWSWLVRGTFSLGFVTNVTFVNDFLVVGYEHGEKMNGVECSVYFYVACGVNNDVQIFNFTNIQDSYNWVAYGKSSYACLRNEYKINK